MGSWTLAVMGIVILFQLPWILHKSPRSVTALKEIVCLSRGELVIKIAGYRRFLGLLGVISTIILTGCVLAIASGLGVVASLATFLTLVSLSYLFVEACSEFKLLKFELSRRDLQLMR